MRGVKRPVGFRYSVWVPPALLLLLALLFGCGRHDAMGAGRAQMAQRNYRSAVIEFKNAVQEEPESVEARLGLADALERIDDSAGVEHHLRSALTHGGDANDLSPRIAFLLLERNDVEKIIQEFKDRRLPAPQADGNLRAIVAMALVAQGRLPSARDELASSPPTPTVALARAQLLLAEGSRAEAMAVLDKAGADADTPWWILRAIGRVTASYGKTDAALTALLRAHEAVPWNNAVTGEYGEALMNAARFAQAAGVRDSLNKTAPGYYWTTYLDASLQMHAGHLDEALAAATRVLALVPEHLPATLIAASAEMQHGEVEMPLKRLTTIVGKYPTSIPASVLLAQAQLRAGKSQAATETVRRGLLRAPDNLALLSQQADLDVMAGRPAQAAARLSAIVARDPKNTAALLRLAELKGRLGDKAEASELLDRVSALAKEDPLLVDRVVATALRLHDVPTASRLAELGVASMPRDAQARLTFAAALAAKKDLAAAWSTTLTSLDLMPTYAPALSALRSMAAGPGQQTELLSRYAKALSASTTDVQTYLDYAARLRAREVDGQGSVDTPLGVLEKGVAMAPEALRLREALIQQYMRDGAGDKALHCAQSGVALANDASPRAQALMAATYERLGKPELAVDIYRRLATSYPQNGDWGLKVVQFETDAGRQGQAESMLRSLITNRPLDPAGYVRLARLEAPVETDKALSVVHHMAEHDVLKKEALLLEGDVLALAGRQADALRQYDKALQGGAVPAAQLRTAGLLDRMGRSSAAESIVRDVVRDYPEDSTVLGFAAQRALAAGDSAAGVGLMKRVVALDPSNPVALNDLAWAQVQALRPEAVANARKATALMPDHPKVLDTLGMALLLAGRSAEAVATLRTASNLAPTLDGAKLHLAQALVAAGDRRGAGEVAKSIASQKLAARDKAILDGIVASTKG